jgi:hypothetical protein
VIPVDGFVLAFIGRERYLAARFTVGRRVAYRLAIRAGDPEFWSRAAEALECGPRLLQAGAETVDARSEGFSHPKIVSLEGRRSAIGITADQTVLLMTTGNATEVQLARVMKTLGARDAMNLDGGASSGLWFQGAYLTSPGRDISHALLVLKRPYALPPSYFVFLVGPTGDIYTVSEKGEKRCRRKRPWRRPKRTSVRAKRHRLRQASSYARRCTTSGRGNMERDRRSRRSPSASRRHVVPA